MSLWRKRFGETIGQDTYGPRLFNINRIVLGFLTKLVLIDVDIAELCGELGVAAV